MNSKSIRIFNIFAIATFAYSCIASGTEDVSATTLDAPQDLLLTYNDGTSMTFAWSAVEGAESYAARMELSSGTLVRQVNTDVNEVTFEGLTKGVEYSVKVKAQNGKVVSEYSDPLVVVAGVTDPEPQPDPDPDPDPEPGPNPEPGPDPEPNDAYSKMMIPAQEDQLHEALAFPGAEGGGMYTTGGRGGKVIHVTNLNDSGAGSLRDAVKQSGARTIVFDVAGIIELKSELVISNGDLTIAGQTAPGDGICLKDYSTRINADNVIIRYIRFRLGDASASDSADAIWGRYRSNVILDHCSMSWSIDECASFYANRNFTLQWCILTESLCHSVHGKGTHGYGGIWGGKNASFHHNLLANHYSRNPRIDHPQIYGEYVDTHRGNVDFRCNAIYNWGDNSTYGGENGTFNIVNNYYKMGPASKDRKYFVDAYAYYEKNGTVYADNYPNLYLSGNVHLKYPEALNDATMVYWHNGSSYGNYNTVSSSMYRITGPSSEAVYTTTHTAAAAFENICRFGGASLRRDAVDNRACTDAMNGTATIMDGGNGSTNGLVDIPSAAGGWPSYSATSDEITRNRDTDSDGIPDWFEDEFGLDKNASSDGNSKTIDIYGRYTNLEMYLHYIVRETVSGQIQGGTYLKIQ
ncbi:MAG: fibronectin type III domain-containing protein [Candidatus Cryptobacteroides sp.]